MMMGLHRSGWQNPRVLSTLLLVFLCGGLTGALVMRYGVTMAVKGLGPYWKEGGKDRTLNKWKTELNLTPDQAEQIEVVLDDFVMYYDGLQAQMDEVKASGKSKIMQILTEEQRKKFEKMVSEMQVRQLH
ncbi:MAG TPA: hypothetical protein DEH78_09555 [Solibacterales bacterium]|nr:hypothetical protein [Bryobacterales bacterium]